MHVIDIQIKSTGPNPDPYETFNVMFVIEELAFLTETYCFLLLKLDLNKVNTNFIYHLPSLLI